MTMNICSLFDRYRDRELDDAARSRFESHLKDCADCRFKMSLLNNLVHAIKSEELRPKDLSAQIARRAFQPKKSWDALVVSLLRPGPALATLAMFIVLFSALWMISSDLQRNSAYYEYEKLMDDADAMNVGSRISQARTDSELVMWLEQEGMSE